MVGRGGGEERRGIDATDTILFKTHVGVSFQLSVVDTIIG